MKLVETSLESFCRMKDIYRGMNQLIQLMKHLDIMQVHFNKYQQQILHQFFIK